MEPISGLGYHFGARDVVNPVPEGLLHDGQQCRVRARLRIGVKDLLRFRPNLFIEGYLHGKNIAADVDLNPMAAETAPVVLNDNEQRIAELFSRYLLYSHQPDEMITFRALARMDPQNRQFDPRMYQYGGLFIYPVGALAKLSQLAGWVQAGDLEFYLNNPGQFGRLYVVARVYTFCWGLLGIVIVFAIGRQLADWRAGALAALRIERALRNGVANLQPVDAARINIALKDYTERVCPRNTNP